jgi:hypothetical protein
MALQNINAHTTRDAIKQDKKYRDESETVWMSLIYWKQLIKTVRYGVNTLRQGFQDSESSNRFIENKKMIDTLDAYMIHSEKALNRLNEGKLPGYARLFIRENAKHYANGLAGIKIKDSKPVVDETDLKSVRDFVEHLRIKNNAVVNGAEGRIKYKNELKTLNRLSNNLIRYRKSWEGRKKPKASVDKLQDKITILEKRLLNVTDLWGSSLFDKMVNEFAFYEFARQAQVMLRSIGVGGLQKWLSDVKDNPDIILNSQKQATETPKAVAPRPVPHGVITERSRKSATPNEVLIIDDPIFASKLKEYLSMEWFQKSQQGLSLWQTWRNDPRYSDMCTVYDEAHVGGQINAEKTIELYIHILSYNGAIARLENVVGRGAVYYRRAEAQQHMPDTTIRWSDIQAYGIEEINSAIKASLLTFMLNDKVRSNLSYYALCVSETDQKLADSLTDYVNIFEEIDKDSKKKRQTRKLSDTEYEGLIDTLNRAHIGVELNPGMLDRIDPDMVKIDRRFLILPFPPLISVSISKKQLPEPTIPAQPQTPTDEIDQERSINPYTTIDIELKRMQEKANKPRAIVEEWKRNINSKRVWYIEKIKRHEDQTPVQTQSHIPISADTRKMIRDLLYNNWDPHTIYSVTGIPVETISLIRGDAVQVGQKKVGMPSSPASQTQISQPYTNQKKYAATISKFTIRHELNADVKEALESSFYSLKLDDLNLDKKDEINENAAILAECVNAMCGSNIDENQAKTFLINKLTKQLQTEQRKTSHSSSSSLSIDAKPIGTGNLPQEQQPRKQVDVDYREDDEEDEKEEGGKSATSVADNKAAPNSSAENQGSAVQQPQEEEQKPKDKENETTKVADTNKGIKTPPLIKKRN